MLTLLARRAASIVPVLLALSAAVFVLQQVSPVDPARALVGERASETVVAETRREMGLDDPMVVQYARYVGRVATGDLGTSAVTRQPVAEDLAGYVPATLELVLVAFGLAVTLGLLFGVLTSGRGRGARVLQVAMVGVASVPVFLTALLGIIYFYRRLGLLPATGRTSINDAPTGPSGFLVLDGVLAGRWDVVSDAWLHLVMPACCLALAPAVAIGRVLRSSLQQTLRSEFARTARAKGLSELQVVVRHATRNSVGPMLAMAGLQFAALFAAVLVVEVIFAWPGLGFYTSQAIAKGDFTTIAGITLVLGGLYVVGNAVVDIGQVAADPRIEH